MVSLIGDGLEQYTVAHTKAPSALLAELIRVTREKTRAPAMQVGPVEGEFLMMMVATTGARRVLEVGTFTGYSALCLAAALPEGGEVVTCDVDPASVAIAQSFFDRAPHGKKIKPMLGSARETIAKLPLDPPFDLVFIDADKGGYIDYYELAMERLRPGGIILGDNALWSGRVLSPADEDDRAIDAFNKHVTRDPRVDNALLPIRDGIMMARKR